MNKTLLNCYHKQTCPSLINDCVSRKGTPFLSMDHHHQCCQRNRLSAFDLPLNVAIKPLHEETKQ